MADDSPRTVVVFDDQPPNSPTSYFRWEVTGSLLLASMLQVVFSFLVDFSGGELIIWPPPAPRTASWRPDGKLSGLEVSGKDAINPE